MTRQEIIQWAEKQNISAHDVFDELNDKHKVIDCFYADKSNDEGGMVLFIDDAEIMAYEYARRIVEQMMLPGKSPSKI